MTKILVVDDDPNVLTSIQTLLEKKGFEVELTNNGRDAVARIQTGRFDLVISDIEIPEMSGIEVVRIVKSQFPNLPIILISCSPSKYQEDIQGLKAVVCLEKPFGIGVLMFHIQQALGF